MRTFTIGRVPQRLIAGLGALLVLGAVIVAVFAAASEEAQQVRIALVVLGFGLAALGAYLLREARRLSELAWEVSDTLICRTAASVLDESMEWDRVHRAAVGCSGDLILESADGRRMRISSVTERLALLFLEVERRSTRLRPVRLPIVLKRRRASRAAYCAIALGMGLFALPIIPQVHPQPVAPIFLVGCLLVLAGIVWWACTASAGPRELRIDTDHLTVIERMRTRTFRLADVRGWAVVLDTTGQARVPELWIETADDSFSFHLSRDGWLEVAAGMRAAAERHPNLTWLAREVIDAPPPPALTPSSARPRWVRGAIAVVSGLAILVATSLAAPPPNIDGPERARILLAAHLPSWATNALHDWLEQHPTDLEAHRLLFAAQRANPPDRRPDLGSTRRRYEELSRAESPLRAQIGAWGLARVDEARGRHDAAIDALDRVDRRLVPAASIDRARLLEDADRLIEARVELERALESPLRDEAAPALASVLVRLRAEQDLRALRSDVGDLIGTQTTRGLAAQDLDLGRWAASYEREALAAPLAVGLAIAFLLAWAALSRFWAGPDAPSWWASVLAAGVGVVLGVVKRFVVDGLGVILSGPTRPVAAAAAEVLLGVLVPVLLVAVWHRFRASKSPLELVTRTGLVAAGLGAVWCATRLLEAGHWMAFEVPTLWLLSPLAAIAAPWTMLVMIDLRRRGLGPLAAGATAVLVTALVLVGARVAACLVNELAGLFLLAAMFGALLTFGPLVRNAATLGRRDDADPGARSAMGAIVGSTAFVFLIAQLGATRSLSLELSLLSMVFPALGALLVVGLAAPSLGCVWSHPAWRSDWWRPRPRG